MEARAQPPIFVIADELLTFPSLEEAESYIEPVDVRRGEYKAAYDREGRRIRIAISSKPICERARWLGSVECVVLAPEDEVRPDELRAKLLPFLCDLGEDADLLGAAPLEVLTTKVAERTMTR